MIKDIPSVPRFLIRSRTIFSLIRRAFDSYGDLSIARYFLFLRLISLI
jgi:hypothetical protein